MATKLVISFTRQRIGPLTSYKTRGIASKEHAYRLRSPQRMQHSLVQLTPSPGLPKEKSPDNGSRRLGWCAHEGAGYLLWQVSGSVTYGKQRSFEQKSVSSRVCGYLWSCMTHNFAGSGAGQGDHCTGVSQGGTVGQLAIP